MAHPAYPKFNVRLRPPRFNGAAVPGWHAAEGVTPFPAEGNAGGRMPARQKEQEVKSAPGQEFAGHHSVDVRYVASEYSTLV